MDCGKWPCVIVKEMLPLFIEDSGLVFVVIHVELLLRGLVRDFLQEKNERI